MAVEIATAYYSLIPSMAGTAAAVRTGLGSAAVTGAFTQGGAAGGAALGAGFAKKAIPLIGGALAAAGIADFFGNAVDAASDLNESGNAVRVTFGDAAGEVERLGSTAADRLGLSKNDFNQVAVRFSAFANTIAGDGGDAIDVLDELTTRGADFASVYNLDVDDALTLFQSGLAGETEPLRRFGIDLSAASVQAYAYRNGIADAGEELTEQQKVQARYQYLLEQTSKTQGDFANTSEDLANQQRRNTAALDDALADIGTALLPAATAFARFIGSEENQERLERIVDLFITLEPAISAVADGALDVADDFLKAIDTVVGLFDAISDGNVTVDEAIDLIRGMPDVYRQIAYTVLRYYGQFVNSIVDSVNTVRGAAADMYNAIARALGIRSRLSFSTIAGFNTTAAIRDIAGRSRGFPGQADGGLTVGAGWSWVGERGPELAYMPEGAQVQPLDAGGTRGLDLSDKTIYKLAQAVSAQVIEADGTAIASVSRSGSARRSALGAA